MAKYSKIGYGNYTDIDSAIAKGVLDGKDLVITKDTSELVYIKNDKTKQVIRTRLPRFDTEDAALATLLSASDTYDGQPVVIKNESGHYQLYLVLADVTERFIVKPVSDASDMQVVCDNKSLIIDNNGKISIAGVEDAAVGSLLTKQADGSVGWIEQEIKNASPLFINIQKFLNRPQANFAYAVNASDFSREATRGEKAIVVVASDDSLSEKWAYVCDGTVEDIFVDAYAVTFNSVVELTSGDSSDKSLGISAAKVGEVAKVKAVDGNGMPTEWETAAIPTKISDLTNDSGFITNIPDEYVTETELDEKGFLTEHQSLADYATQRYVDEAIANIDIPDTSKFITSIPDEYITETELDAKGYLTEHQDLTNYALKSDIPTLDGYAKTAELDTKQDKLTAGAGISIKDNIISATGGGTGFSGVESVNEKTGVVTLTAADVGAPTATITDNLGVATIFNESGGGGAMFKTADGIQSYVGVSSGQRVNAQIYAVDTATGTGTRFNIKKEAIYYLPNAASGTQATADDELAVKGDIPKSSSEENKITITEDGTMEVNSLNISKIVQEETDELVVNGGNA